MDEYVKCTYEHVTRKDSFIFPHGWRFLPPLPNLSHLVSPRGAVHAGLLTKHQKRVRVCCKLLFVLRAAHQLVQLPQRPRVLPSLRFPPSQASLKMLSKMLSRRLLAHQFSRGLATHAPNPFPIPASLHLKSGQTFHGRSFGAPKSIYGETVFSTSITSCQFYRWHWLATLSHVLLPWQTRSR